MTGYSRSTVMRVFERESGAIILERPVRMHKHRYGLRNKTLVNATTSVPAQWKGISK